MTSGHSPTLSCAEWSARLLLFCWRWGRGRTSLEPPADKPSSNHVGWATGSYCHHSSLDFLIKLLDSQEQGGERSLLITSNMIFMFNLVSFSELIGPRERELIFKPQWDRLTGEVYTGDILALHYITAVSPCRYFLLLLLGLATSSPVPQHRPHPRVTRQNQNLLLVQAREGQTLAQSRQDFQDIDVPAGEAVDIFYR